MTSPTNFQRAAWAEAAIVAFIEQTNCDHDNSLGDLLCDLMHWAKSQDFDFDQALERAQMHFVAETIEEAGL